MHVVIAMDQRPPTISNANTIVSNSDRLAETLVVKLIKLYVLHRPELKREAVGHPYREKSCRWFARPYHVRLKMEEVGLFIFMEHELRQTMVMLNFDVSRTPIWGKRPR